MSDTADTEILSSEGSESVDSLEFLRVAGVAASNVVSFVNCPN
jgi:hypothetical protein